MNKFYYTTFLIYILSQIIFGANTENFYPPSETRKISPKNSVYYIHPANGDDNNSGLTKNDAWRTFIPLNRLFLSAGNRIEIIAPGSFEYTLMPMGSGSKESPVEIHFAPGQYHFYPKKALKRKYHISNTNDAPDEEKNIAILLQKAEYFKITGENAEIIYHGKMIEMCIDGCKNITIAGLSFDYNRPTVSEFRLIKVQKNYADLQIHPDSRYKIVNGDIIWIGEGWQYEPGYTQELDLQNNMVWRRNNPLKGLRLVEIAPFIVRAYGKHNMKKERVYQQRDTRRDYAAVFTRRSKNIRWRNLRFYFMHGMGMVSQFSENITFDNVSIAPREDSGRTCAAWADCIQVSGCKGKISIKNCTFNGANDDAVNIHGTHLRVVDILSKNRLIVRFMHPQTYGFMAFNPGDAITFVRWDKLDTFGANKIKNALMLDEKEILLTLDQPIPASLRKKDAIENITWTPQVEINNCRVSRIPTRGFLITTRRKAIIENNLFLKTFMSAVLVEDDAKGWYESGCVRDMTILGNKFICCGEPVININPQNSAPNDSVHQNIRIKNNKFNLCGEVGIKVRSTSDLEITHNLFYAEEQPVKNKVLRIKNCIGVNIENNKFLISANGKLLQKKLKK